MRIAVIGCGIVGGAVADGLERLGHKIFRHDPKLYGTTLDDVLAFTPEIAFICVPTPQRPDGSCDTGIVEMVVDSLTDRKFQGVIAIKSTVEPGTTRRLYTKFSNRYWHGSVTLAFVPEFLREKSAFYDFTEGHDVCAIGLVGGFPEMQDKVYELIKKAHGHYPQEFVRLQATEAELLKYFSNVYNALRVTFANGFYDVCQKLNADYSKIKNAATKRPTIMDKYLDCNENWRGFAGPCLPKDSAAFAHLVKTIGVDAKIFQTIIEDNALYKPTVPDGMRME